GVSRAVSRGGAMASRGGARANGGRRGPAGARRGRGRDRSRGGTIDRGSGSRPSAEAEGVTDSDRRNERSSPSSRLAPPPRTRSSADQRSPGSLYLGASELALSCE